MTPATQWAIVAVFMFLAAMFFAALAMWCARKALQQANRATEGWLAAARYQQQVGENAPDALRWRLHLADCARGGKTRSQTQATLVAQTSAALARGE